MPEGRKLTAVIIDDRIHECSACEALVSPTSVAQNIIFRRQTMCFDSLPLEARWFHGYGSLNTFQSHLSMGQEPPAKPQASQQTSSSSWSDAVGRRSCVVRLMEVRTNAALGTGSTGETSLIVNHEILSTQADGGAFHGQIGVLHTHRHTSGLSA